MNGIDIELWYVGTKNAKNRREIASIATTSIGRHRFTFVYVFFFWNGRIQVVQHDDVTLHPAILVKVGVVSITEQGTYRGEIRFFVRINRANTVWQFVL